MGNPHRFRLILNDEEAAEYVGRHLPRGQWPQPISVTQFGLIYSRQDLDDAIDRQRGPGQIEEAS